MNGPSSSGLRFGRRDRGSAGPAKLCRAEFLRPEQISKGSKIGDETTLSFGPDTTMVEIERGNRESSHQWKRERLDPTLRYASLRRKGKKELPIGIEAGQGNVRSELSIWTNQVGDGLIEGLMEDGPGGSANLSEDWLSSSKDSRPAGIQKEAIPLVEAGGPGDLFPIGDELFGSLEIGQGLPLHFFLAQAVPPTNRVVEWAISASARRALPPKARSL